jgi:hypothetical protein
MKRLLALVVVVASLLALAAAGVAPRASARANQACATGVFESGLDVVFGRARTQAAADRITARAHTVGFGLVRTVRESCNVWKSAMRGLDSFDTAVGVQSEARRVKMTPTIECVRAQEIGQIQAIFGTRRTVGELGSQVVDRANSFGYRGLKTKKAPCGGYQAYVAGFKSDAEAQSFAQTARERTGLPVYVIKA